MGGTQQNLEIWRRMPAFRGAAVDFLAGMDGLLAGLHGSDRPAIRWSVLLRPALLIGSSQRPSEVDFAACDALGVLVHKRPSGGTAVFAGTGLLSLDVALPAGHRLLPASVTETYRWFGEVWAAALAGLGIDGRAIPPEEARPLNAALEPAVSRVCFGGISPYEVLVGGRKIVGLSQVRRRQGALLKAGIYLRWEPERIVELLAGTDEERTELEYLLRARAYGIHDLLGPSIMHADVVAAWEHTLGAQQGVELKDHGWTAEELAAAEAAAAGRYAPLTTLAAVAR